MHGWDAGPSVQRSTTTKSTKIRGSPFRLATEGTPAGANSRLDIRSTGVAGFQQLEENNFKPL